MSDKENSGSQDPHSDSRSGEGAGSPAPSAISASGEEKLSRGQRWLAACSVYLKRPVLTMLALGFSAGLPILLVFGTLSAWMREDGISLKEIGLFSTVGLIYSIKVFWSPLVDQLRLPGLTRILGQRRSWMLLGQAGIIAGLLGIAFSTPSEGLWTLYIMALAVAFSSATQDIAIDAWRIEAAATEFQAAMSATYVFGYRVGMLIAGGAGTFYIADIASWPVAYMAMAGLMLSGVITVLLIPEPEEVRNRLALLDRPEIRDFRASIDKELGIPALGITLAWLYGAIWKPFSEFFTRNKVQFAGLLVGFIGLYRLSDITLGIFANAFYLDLGFTKSEIASVTKLFGLATLLAGGFVGGLLVARFGVYRILLLGAVMVAGTNLLFAVLASMGSDLEMLALVISADNLSAGIATTAFIAFLSGLTNQAYTATQYALFSSLMLIPGKSIGAISGSVAQDWGYEVFFIYVSLLGIPAIILVLILMARKPLKDPSKDQPAAAVDAGL